MTKYEYNIVHLPFAPTSPDNVAYLNRLGELGWELVSAAATQQRYRVGTRHEYRLEQICYFRRPACGGQALEDPKP